MYVQSFTQSEVRNCLSNTDRSTDRQTEPPSMSARQMDCKQRNRLPGRQTDCQADRRNVRQTDGMSDRHMDCKDTQTAR